jgi:hypothetical protein
MNDRSTARFMTIAGLVLLVTLPVATWWLIGDLSWTGSEDLDYLVRAPAVPAAAERAFGIGALLAAVGALAAMIFATTRRRIHPSGWLCVPPVVLAGIVAGLLGRVVTAGGVGVNFGAIFGVVLGIPAVLLLLVSAALTGVVLRASARQRAAGLPVDVRSIALAAGVYGAGMVTVPASYLAFSAISFYVASVVVIALVVLGVRNRRRRPGPARTPRRVAAAAAGYGALIGAFVNFATLGLGSLLLLVAAVVTALMVGVRIRRRKGPGGATPAAGGPLLAYL